MKRISIPNFQKKQRLLYLERRSAEELIDYGDHYLTAGRIFDAVDCYQRANHTSGLERIRDIAESMGDVMLFQQVMKWLGRPITADEWDRIGRQALSSGKNVFSLQAFDKSANESMLERVKEIIKAQGNESIS